MKVTCPRNKKKCKNHKGPVKLIKRVKIAHSFLQSVSDAHEFISLFYISTCSFIDSFHLLKFTILMKNMQKPSVSNRGCRRGFD